MACFAALLIGLSIGALADQPPEVLLPHRTVLAVRLDTTVKANRAHVGDAVTATLVSPVLLHGEVVVPMAAKLKGRVLVVQAHAHAVLSRLIVRFDDARWAGQSVKLNAYIAHQIIEKLIVVSEVDRGCAPQERDSVGAGISRGPGSNLASWSGCPEGTIGGRAERNTEFSTPAMKDITVRRPRNPPHTIELVSAKKNIVLHRGVLLELRHLAPPAQ